MLVYINNNNNRVTFVFWSFAAHHLARQPTNYTDNCDISYTWVYSTVWCIFSDAGELLNMDMAISAILDRLHCVTIHQHRNASHINLLILYFLFYYWSQLLFLFASQFIGRILNGFYWMTSSSEWARTAPGEIGYAKLGRRGVSNRMLLAESEEENPWP